MSEVGKLIESLTTDWVVPKAATHAGQTTAVALACRFEPPASAIDLAAAAAAPSELLDFWQRANGASLFVDDEYGQWGLRLLTIRACMAATETFLTDRADDCLLGDFVIGEFLGDSDVLLVRCDPAANDFGAVMVALPLDERAEWECAATSLGAFLVAYAKSDGQKFWRQ